MEILKTLEIVTRAEQLKSKNIDNDVTPLKFVLSITNKEKVEKRT